MDDSTEDRNGATTRRPRHIHAAAPPQGGLYRSANAGAAPAARMPVARRRYSPFARTFVVLASVASTVVVGHYLVTAAQAARIQRRAAQADAATPTPDPRTPGAVAVPSGPGPDARATGNSPSPFEVPPPVIGARRGAVLTSQPVRVEVDGFFSWALMDRRTGGISGSANAGSATSSTESMIKIWIASDYLRLLAARGAAPSQDRLNELSIMIRDSDDDAAEDIYQVDGDDDVVDRMISICGLTGTTPVDGWWSRTQITAADAVRLGWCVASGRAAGAAWTPWILQQMRGVRGEGRFGIIDTLPAATAAGTAIKNGWTLVYADGQWHIACLAIQEQWILAVLTRYDRSRGLSYGAGICTSVTRQLMSPA